MYRPTIPTALRATTLVAFGLILCGPARSQDRKDNEDRRTNNFGVIVETPPPTSGVVDKAALFSPEAVKKAIGELERIEKTYGFATVVETVDSLKGANIKFEATRKAADSRANGLYLLIDKQEHKYETVIAPRFRRAIPEEARASIGKALLARFKERDFDGGLAGGIAALESSLGHAKAENLLPTARVAHADGSSLVVHDQSRLTLAGAKRIIEAAEAKAAALGVKENIAVVDDGGHLLGFSRMDGARPASVDAAMARASNAATFRQETGPTSGDGGVGKSAAGPGGVPVTVNGQVIGAVGVAGASGDQDVEVARAGVAKFLESVNGGSAEDEPGSGRRK